MSDQQETLRVMHARTQGAADGFQQGWHAAIKRLREGDAIDDLSAVVPDPSFYTAELLEKLAAAAAERLSWEQQFHRLADAIAPYRHTPEDRALWEHEDGTVNVQALIDHCLNARHVWEELVTAEAQRDEARNAVQDMVSQAVYMLVLERMADAEQSLASLQQQLTGLVERGFVWHKFECGTRNTNNAGYPNCTCGLADLLLSLTSHEENADKA